VIEQLSGKTALVTGGTSGVGKAIARELARRGAQLILVGRHARTGALAEREIRDSSGNTEVEFLQADLSLVSEAQRVAERAATRWPAMHYLVESAGIVRGRRVVTAEGFESNFATNYLSRFALTVRLLPTLQAAGRPGKAARILLVAHPGFNGPIHYDDVNLTNNFAMIRAFKQFHFANDVFATELARRLAVPGDRPSVTVSCLHPGPTKTTGIDKEMPLWMRLMVRLVVHPLISHNPDVPAAVALKLLLSDEYEGDSAALFSMIKKFQRVTPPRNVQDAEEGKRLWAASEDWVGSAIERRIGSLPGVALDDYSGLEARSKMDEDIEMMDRDALLAEVRRLRAAIREHRDSSGHDLCWHHPKLWSLLPEGPARRPTVPDWPEFLRGCVRYRESLDRELSQAESTKEEF
jgi:NAD(P)-dependent dehydrogenase (short-subunit alcohol dehydrogenase family)